MRRPEDYEDDPIPAESDGDDENAAAPLRTDVVDEEPEPTEDEDDEAEWSMPGGVPRGAPADAASVLAPPRVPFTRPFYGPQHPKGTTRGRDVVAVKRAFSRAGYLPWKNFTPVWGKGPVQMCARFQRDHGITATGNYGPKTHEALRTTRSKGHPNEWAFDAFSTQIMRNWEPPEPPPSDRDRAVDLALWTVDIRDMIDYTQMRPIYPIYHNIRPPANPRHLDCSGHYKYVLWAALGIDVDGLHAYGNTYTMIQHGRHVEVHDVRPGDAIYYRGHIVFVISNNGAGSIRVVSHGQQSGPVVLPYNYRTDIIGARDHIGG